MDTTVKAKIDATNYPVCSVTSFETLNVRRPVGLRAIGKLTRDCDDYGINVDYVNGLMTLARTTYYLDEPTRNILE